MKIWDMNEVGPVTNGLTWLVTGRQYGKTLRAVEWVKAGSETTVYPGWSRVFVTHTISEADRIRKQYGLDYRQVFSLAEIRDARFGTPRPAAAIDNLDLMLAEILGYNATPEFVTMTGSTYTKGN